MLLRSADAVLVDPMCGSGTFLIEAALIASRAAPGLSRGGWPFQRWPDFDAQAWGAAAAQAALERRPWSGSALGNDDHEGALSLAARWGLGCSWSAAAVIISGSSLLSLA